MRHSPQRRRRHQGFTLLELLIGLGIIGVLASIVIVAVNPLENLLAAKDAERKLNARTYQNALFQHLIGEGRFPNQSQMVEGDVNAKQICTYGVTTNTNCVQVDALVPDYTADLPRDETEPCPDYTGYMVYLTSGSAQVYALHMGKKPGDEITVTAGCSVDVGEVSSTSASASASSSSAGTSSVAASSVAASSEPASSEPASSAAPSSEGGSGGDGGYSSSSSEAYASSSDYSSSSEYYYSSDSSSSDYWSSSDSSSSDWSSSSSFDGYSSSSDGWWF